MEMLQNWPRGLSAGHCLRRERWFKLCQVPLSETTERGSLDRLSDTSRCQVMGRRGSCSYETLTQSQAVPHLPAQGPETRAAAGMRSQHGPSRPCLSHNHIQREMRDAFLSLCLG